MCHKSLTFFISYLKESRGACINNERFECGERMDWSAGRWIHYGVHDQRGVGQRLGKQWWLCSHGWRWKYHPNGLRASSLLCLWSFHNSWFPVNEGIFMEVRIQDICKGGEKNLGHKIGGSHPLYLHLLIGQNKTQAFCQVSYFELLHIRTN